MIRGVIAVVMGAVAAGGVTTACNSNLSCKPIVVHAKDAVGGKPIRAIATDKNGHGLANVHLGLALRPVTGGKILFEDTIETDRDGVATLDPAADFLGRFANEAHTYDVGPAGDTLGRSDEGYCSSVRASARFEYVDPSALPSATTNLSRVIADVRLVLAGYHSGGGATSDELVRTCVALDQRVSAFDNSTDKGVLALRKRLGERGRAALARATHECAFDPLAAANDLAMVRELL